MNFLCSPVRQDNPYHLTEHKIGDYFVYLDRGWTHQDGYFFKGIKSDWCKIRHGRNLTIETNKFRGFPIYTNGTDLSNFANIGDVVPVDGIASIKDNAVSISYHENFYPKIPNDHLSFKESTDILYDAVVENVGSFIANNKNEVMIPEQNGIDTLLARSAFDYLGAPYKLFTFDTKPELSLLGDHLAKSYWGFAQVPEFRGKVIVSGFHGDEWILRNPYYAHVLLSARGVSITEKFDSIGDCYMKKFFDRLYRKKCLQPYTKTREQLLTEICNDFQIWHLNDTTILSPLKHESLLVLLAADNDTIVSQVTDAELSKAVIGKLNPKLLDLLDKHKNQHDPDFFWPER